MNILGKLLAEGLEVRRQAHVRQVKAVGDRWQLEFGDEEVLVAKTVLINTPATQALELCKRVELNAEIETALSAVKFQPCFAVLAGYPSDLAPEWKGVNVEGHLDLAWIAHDSSKRASPSQTVFVLHSTPAFAQKHFFDPPDQVEERLLEAASILGDFVTRPLWTDRQRWRYALADHPAQKPYYSHRNSLFFCGDWCGGARIESAYRSGVEVAEAMLRAQTAEPQL
ncbi:MAG: FAD-dependent oxidoreductase [Trueperaceae bacterium]|nr:MAG: FAD-dependent oxidoreductase [Trueperaceae bacterium]